MIVVNRRAAGHENDKERLWVCILWGKHLHNKNDRCLEWSCASLSWRQEQDRAIEPETCLSDSRSYYPVYALLSFFSCLIFLREKPEISKISFKRISQSPTYKAKSRSFHLSMAGSAILHSTAHDRNLFLAFFKKSHLLCQCSIVHIRRICAGEVMS